MFSHVVLLEQDPLLRISDNDKPESLACDEYAERIGMWFKNVSINARHNRFVLPNLHPWI